MDKISKVKPPYTSKVNPQVTIENLPEGVTFLDGPECERFFLSNSPDSHVGFEVRISKSKDGKIDEVVISQYPNRPHNFRLRAGENVTLTNEIGKGVKVTYKK